MLILGIESSCDETAAAVVRFSSPRNSAGLATHHSQLATKVLSDVVFSQIAIHRQYGGVVPEVAARAHIEKILPVVAEALKTASVKPGDLDAIAVTNGPGLITSLLVGAETAKNLSYAWDKPLVAVNHLEGHITANWLRPIGGNSKSKITNPKIVFPAVCLVVSGGHTELVLMKKYGDYKKIGQTRDDAAGEAFDKVAKLLDVGYPGGPIISRLAANGNPLTFSLPRPMINDKSFDFSFSGLKTAVLYLTQNLKIKKPRGLQAKELEKNNLPYIPAKAKTGSSARRIADVCASFQQAAVDVLIAKTTRAAEKYQVQTVMLAGGVAANQLLRETLAGECRKRKLNFSAPPKNMCTDNAAMIAAAGGRHFLNNDFTPWQKLKVDPNLEL